MSEEQERPIQLEVGVKLDLMTLMYITNDLFKKARSLEDVSDSGLLGEGVDKRIDTLKAMARHYAKIARQVAGDAREELQKEQLKNNEQVQPVDKRPRDFLIQAIVLVLSRLDVSSCSARGVVQYIKTTPKAKELCIHTPTVAQVADALSAHSRGPNPKLMRSGPGIYKLNPHYKRKRLK